MRPESAARLASLLVAGLALPSAAAAAAPGAARTSGHESFQVRLVASGTSGSRTIVDSTVVAGGVFNGFGRDVEVPSRPNDPDNVLRDKLVFRHGTLRIVATSQPPAVSVDPQTCAVTLTAAQTGRIEGGTGRFRHASGRFAGKLHSWAVAGRNADGTCSQATASLLEVDVISAHGRLSF